MEECQPFNTTTDYIDTNIGDDFHWRKHCYVCVFVYHRIWILSPYTGTYGWKLKMIMSKEQQCHRLYKGVLGMIKRHVRWQ